MWMTFEFKRLYKSIFGVFIKLWLVFSEYYFLCTDLQQEEEAADSDVPEWESPYFVDHSTGPANQGKKRGSFKKVGYLLPIWLHLSVL